MFQNVLSEMLMEFSTMFGVRAEYGRIYIFFLINSALYNDL